MPSWSDCSPCESLLDRLACVARTSRHPGKQGSVGLAAAPRLGGNQGWLLVDNDVTVLEAVEPALRAWAESLGLKLEVGSETLTIRNAGLHCSVRRQRLDLAED